ncbi:MAG TPA: NADPH-dependent 7-cyano-7-deazaguanine reductase QueF [Syntrophales bacterium]|nr:NADPH-dependent 7-cyano-7-deazaguanine reductase QueF [Syntrophales bacterium]HRT61552.1 NADPH-dependent 7-cyano-7-deazaguanine reductase QueF [Syntrophales bacterium]
MRRKTKSLFRRETPPYRDHYDPRLLLPVPRATHRARIGIGRVLPFGGVDLWNAYELSWLDPGGKPRVAIATIAFPAQSPCLIESRSMKLYLNSFNQSRFAGLRQIAETMRRDLSRACGSGVKVDIMPPEKSGGLVVEELEGKLIDGIRAGIARYKPDPSLLSARGAVVEEVLTSNLLKSNCPLTGQPDWASLQIRYRGPRISRTGLLRYIVSFRRHGDFHEHCVERIFMDLLRRCRPERLTVYARYTRRGGIDINPFRTNCGDAPPANHRTARQ